MTKKAQSWLDALGATGLEVKSARDALSVKGWLDTGNYALNWAISGRLLRGYPLGHTVEMFGDPGTGKSYLVSQALRAVQERGGVALLDDTEGGHNLEWMERIGVDTERLAVRRSRTVKQHLEVAQGFIAAYRNMKIQAPGVLACDSLSLLSTEHELEVGLDKRDMSKAGELKTFFRIVGAEFINLPMVHISTSHKIANIGNFYKPTTTPGGGGPKFQATVRLDLRSIKRIKSGNEYVGVIARCVVDKNRIVAPWKETSLAIPFHQPISPASGLIPLLLDLGVLDTSGHYLTYQGKQLPVKAMKSDFLRQDEEAEKLLDHIPEILEETDHFLSTGELRGPPALEDVEEG